MCRLKVVKMRETEEICIKILHMVCKRMWTLFEVVGYVLSQKWGIFYQGHAGQRLCLIRIC